MTFLATRGLVDQTECGFVVMACAANTLKRVCASFHAHCRDVPERVGRQSRSDFTKPLVNRSTLEAFSSWTTLAWQ